MKPSFYLHPTISYRSIEKAGISLELFIQVYFRFYGISAKRFFKYFGTFVYTEAVIYQIDEEYEENINNKNFKSEHLQILYDFLHEKSLFDSEIEQEILCGMQYYALENKMCQNESFSFEEVKLANQHKCFDFRVLHRLLYKLANVPYDEKLIAAFCPIEMLGNISDDIMQYENDEQRNVYNTYRMIIKLYPNDSQNKMQEYIEELKQMFYDSIKILRWRLRLKLYLYYKIGFILYPMPKIPDPILKTIG